MIVIVTRDSKPILIVQGAFADLARKICPVGEVLSYSLPASPVNTAAEVFQRLRLGKARVASELGYEQRMGVSYLEFTRLRELLPRCKFEDGSDVIWALRMVKSRYEVSCMKKACEVTGRAYKETFESARVGMTERDVISILKLAMIRNGAERIGFVAINSGPHNYGLSSAQPGEHRLEKKRVLWIDSGCLVDGYWSDFDRMASIGPATPDQVKYHRIVSRITKEALDSTREGVHASEIALACADKFKEQSVNLKLKSGRIGHGMGLLLTEPPHISSYDNTRLETGMTLTLEPTLLNAHGPFQLEQDFLIRSDGIEILSKCSTELAEIK
jgi:Xaa-Pro aminopeptidase